MDGTGQNAFSRSRFAEDENNGIGRRNLLHFDKNILHCFGITDDALISEFFFRVFPQREILCPGRTALLTHVANRLLILFLDFFPVKSAGDDFPDQIQPGNKLR